MWYGLGWIFCGVFVGFVITVILACIQMDKKDAEYRAEINFWERSAIFWSEHYDKMELKYRTLYKTCARSGHQQGFDTLGVNEIQDVVKYAMKKSHPDNGGTAEEFRKYRDMYNKVTNK